ncbi:Leukocyte receptor cluster member 1 [Chytriomyces hyalinus]|nr:Leukocyte receptor cluster member 1 [Chytriomyces hyalinus]
MGGGGLVILKHKSWHVYNEKNREKVRKDEEKAKLEDDEKAARATRADQERRLGILRSKSKSHRKDDDPTPANQPSASSIEAEFGGKEGVHVNLFGELESERVQRKDGRNEEHEAEKAAEKAKFEKQFTMHLGDESVTGPTPWYAKDEQYADRHVSKKSKMEQKSLARNDPLAAFKSKDDDFSKRSKEKRETKKDDKKRDKKKSHSKSKSIEQLRAERLSREGKERSRELELLRPSAPITTATEREMPYNSGFNPDFQRKRKR